MSAPLDSLDQKIAECRAKRAALMRTATANALIGVFLLAGSIGLYAASDRELSNRMLCAVTVAAALWGTGQAIGSLLRVRALGRLLEQMHDAARLHRRT